jgi:3-deoxy-D-manno-octulosonic-acid transferase
VKRFVRAPAVQSALGWLVAGYIELIIRTMRWRFEGRANVDAIMRRPEGLIALFWHGRIAQGMACRPLLAAKPRRVLISLSPDGEFIAKAAQRLRIPPLRGSASRGGSKGGARAFREALSFIASGGVMIINPDGPRGPREELPLGPLLMARAAGCPVFVMSLAAAPALTLGSWDRARIPLPFARGQVVLEGPLELPPGAGDLEDVRQEWQEKMRAGQARAEALLAERSRATPTLMAYGVATKALGLIAPALLHWRAWQGKEDPRRLGERLGKASLPRPGGALVWLHGASVGEGLALVSLAEQMRALRPDLNLLLTTGTRAAAEMIPRRLEPGSEHQYAPVDVPAAARRFIGHWRPDLAVFIESELWPNLILTARASGAKLALVSAKMSESSVQNWRRAPRTAAEVLGAFDLIIARDAIQSDNLKALGARVGGVWDAKLAAPPLSVDPATLEAWRANLDGRPLILAASTHEGEEPLIAEAFAGAAASTAGLLVIAPRHPRRAAALATQVRRTGMTVALASAGPPAAPAHVIIVDSVGELGLWYRLAALAIVGGSLVAGVGGHNPLEPARLGCPFVAGTHTEAWPIYQRFAAAGATRIIAARESLVDLIGQALRRPAAIAAMGQRAADLAREWDAEADALAPRLLGLLG